MRRLFHPMRSPFGPFALSAAIGLAQFVPSEGAVPDVRQRERSAEFANMVGALPEGASITVAAN